MGKLIITCAITGSIHTPTMSPTCRFQRSKLLGNLSMRRKRAHQFYTCMLVTLQTVTRLPGLSISWRF